MTAHPHVRQQHEVNWEEYMLKIFGRSLAATCLNVQRVRRCSRRLVRTDVDAALDFDKHVKLCASPALVQQVFLAAVDGVEMRKI
jgi:hypothetical protein